MIKRESNKIQQEYVTAGKDVVGRDKVEIRNYYTTPQEYEEDLGIIQDIFNYILSYPKKETKPQEKDLIDVKEKIKINFQDIGEISELLLRAYGNMNIIEELYESLDNYDQSLISSDVFNNYLELKYEGGYSTEQILFRLFNIYVPIGKEKNPQYKSMARSLVFFFFEDCTWGEKTEKEKLKELEK